MRHGPERPLGHQLSAVDGFERQHGVLEIGRQEQEVEELGHSRPREPQLPRHVSPVGDDLEAGAHMAR
jgi:hypothetical protein